MGMSAQEIENMVKEALPDAVVELVDMAGDNDHYGITVTSEAFRGLSRVAQHQLVFGALKGGMGTTLHALAVTTKLPA